MSYANKLIIANWKMNPETVSQAVALAKASDMEGLVICPPFVFLEEVAKVLQKSQLGAQDLFWQGPTGAFTGEVSARELKNLGAEYVIVGHSERRLNLGETNEMVAGKFVAAVNEGLIPILCVGETLEQKRRGQQGAIIKQQLQSVFKSRIENLESRIYIAYEPIWAIGTGQEADPREVLKTIEFIKKILASFPTTQKLVSLRASDSERGNLLRSTHIHFLYGGSIDSSNAQEFFQHDIIAGALVGSASLDPEEIKKIVEISQN